MTYETINQVLVDESIPESIRRGAAIEYFLTYDTYKIDETKDPFEQSDAMHNTAMSHVKEFLEAHNKKAYKKN